VSDPAPTIEQLLGKLAERDAVIEDLQARIVELERRLGQNSKNSSQAPSGDRRERSPPRAAQRKADRKPGKQPGRQGFGSGRSESPDPTSPTMCRCVCGLRSGVGGCKGGEGVRPAGVRHPRGQRHHHRAPHSFLPVHVWAAHRGRRSGGGSRTRAFHWKHALLCGLATNPRRDGPRQSKTRNLLTRLSTRDEQVLLFARDLRVSFTNNQAEGDLRPVKTQLKISGFHRVSGGAQAWRRIRGYISTMRKNGAPVLTGLRGAITGNPWTPATA